MEPDKICTGGCGRTDPKDFEGNDDLCVACTEAFEDVAREEAQDIAEEAANTQIEP